MRLKEIHLRTNGVRIKVEERSQGGRWLKKRKKVRDANSSPKEKERHLQSLKVTGAFFGDWAKQG